MAFGIALYPHLFTDDLQLDEYLLTAKKSNIKIIFTTLINFKQTNKNLLNTFKNLLVKAQQLNFDVCVDVNETLLQEFNIELSNCQEIISFFKLLNVKMIRLDEGFSNETIIALSKNQENIKIIINGTNPINELQDLFNLHPNFENLIACWNFYPQRYTASGIKLLQRNINFLKSFHIGVQTFCTLQRKDAQGPWEFNDKLPSLEFHRDLPLEFQIQHLLALGSDDVIVAQQFLNTAEFETIVNLNINKISLKIEIHRKLLVSELQILQDSNIHKVRKDFCEDLHRSTLSRIKYQNLLINPIASPDYFYPGDVVILNDEAKNYKGELQIILQKIKNDGIRNLVGKIDLNEQVIVNCFKANQEFCFKNELWSQKKS